MSTDTYETLTGEVAAGKYYQHRPGASWFDESDHDHEVDHAATELPARGGGGA